MTGCSALTEPKDGEDRESFNMRREPKPAVDFSWGAEGISGHLGTRPDDRPRPEGGDCRCRPGEERRRRWGVTPASRAS